MSHTFRNIVDALILGFAFFMLVLAYQNGKIADESLKRELQKPTCVSVPYQASARNEGATCFKSEPSE